jgi:hypothetical protein
VICTFSVGWPLEFTTVPSMCASGTRTSWKSTLARSSPMLRVMLPAWPAVTVPG